MALRGKHSNMKILLLLLISSVCFAQKPQPKDTANYFLVGKLADFQLLYKAVADPDNVTRKQVSDLAHWLVQARMIVQDTSKQLPKTGKP